MNGKPDPEPYRKGAELLGLSPSECVVIEDAPAGIASGRAAGARVIALAVRIRRRNWLSECDRSEPG